MTRRDEIATLIEQSSLGTPEAQALRRRASRKTVHQIMARVVDDIGHYAENNDDDSVAARDLRSTTAASPEGDVGERRFDWTAEYAPAADLARDWPWPSVASSEGPAEGTAEWHVRGIARVALEVETSEHHLEGLEEALGPSIRIARLLGHLGPEQQECLRLRFFEGRSLIETAELMGRNVGAVKALQYRAVRALGRVLHDE